MIVDYMNGVYTGQVNEVGQAHGEGKFEGKYAVITGFFKECKINGYSKEAFVFSLILIDHYKLPDGSVRI